MLSKWCSMFMLTNNNTMKNTITIFCNTVPKMPLISFGLI